MKRRTYHQLLTLQHRSLCYSYAELARAGIEPGTSSNALLIELTINISVISKYFGDLTFEILLSDGFTSVGRVFG